MACAGHDRSAITQIGSGWGIEQHKDRGRADIGNIGPTEDAVMRRFSAAAPEPTAVTNESDVQTRVGVESII